MATIALERELQTTREVVRLAYGIGCDIERAGLLKKLGKKRKYRKLKARFRALVGLAHQAAFIELAGYRMALEARLDADHEKGGLG